MKTIQKLVAPEIKSLKEFSNKTIYVSDDIRIINYQCDCEQSFTSQEELCGYFSIGFTRRGNYHFHSSGQSTDVYNSRILIEKPECQYHLTHTSDACSANTFIVFSKAFYKTLQEKYDVKNSVFFNNKNILSLVMQATPELELLHYSIWQKIQQKENFSLEIDSLVIELLHNIIENLTCGTMNIEIPKKLKKNHLPTIERAKEFILKNFQQNISLTELAKYCCVSLFHFSRTFKQISSFSPYRYLQDLRLKNAEMLLKTTTLPIIDICFTSGFNSLDYFSSAFSKKYNLPPSKYRAFMTGNWNLARISNTSPGCAV